MRKPTAAPLLMLDLCSGLGGASQPMIDRGWDVVRLDIDPSFGPDIIADVRNWTYSGPRPDLIWASPPCDEFAREFMPWSKTGLAPDLSIALACKRIIDRAKPRYWIIENVKAAVRWLRPELGYPSYVYNPWYLWGFFPPLERRPIDYRHKQSLSSAASTERAMIPYKLAEQVAVAIEVQPPLGELMYA